MKKHNIVGIGEIVWDMLPAGKQLGGAPVNFAFYAQELGAQSIIVSAVGHDALGDEILERVTGYGMDISAIQRNTYPTSTVDITLTGDGIPTYVICEQVAWDYIDHSPAIDQIIAQADAVCWGSLAQRNGVSGKNMQDIIALAPAGCLKVFDINIRLNYFSEEVVRKSIEQADILKLNEDELPKVADLFGLKGDDLKIIRQLIEQFQLTFVVYTKGAECSIVVGKDGQISHIDTPKVEVADTVGAGDAFTATFVTMLLQGAPMEECHRRAVEISAFVCTQNGAITPL